MGAHLLGRHTVALCAGVRPMTKMIHRLALLEHGSCFTRCGIKLSDVDTALTSWGSPIETTHHDGRMTCEDCMRGAKRGPPKLRLVQ